MCGGRAIGRRGRNPATLVNNISTARQLSEVPVFFDCADIEATHRVLSERGVRFAMPPARQQFGWWSLFEDNEGTRYALSQWQEPAPQPAGASGVAAAGEAS